MHKLAKVSSIWTFFILCGPPLSRLFVESSMEYPLLAVPGFKCSARRLWNALVMIREIIDHTIKGYGRDLGLIEQFHCTN